MANRIEVIISATADKATSTIKGFRQSVAEADGATGKLKAGWGSLMESFGNSKAAQAAAVGAALAVGKASIEAASNLEESINAINVSYGSAADGVLKLGETSAESFGLSQRAFNEFAVQFASFANGIAASAGRQVTDVVQEMTTRVADFASVMNLDVPEAAAIFQSALAGETEPIRRFGIDLSAAAVSAHAVEAGITDSAASMTEAQKVQARYSLLMRETNKVSGDFANTSDGLANSTRIAKAQLEDLQAALGRVLIPAVSDAVSEFTSFVEKMQQVKAAADNLPGPLGEVSQNIDKIATAASRGVLGLGDLQAALVGSASKKVELDQVFTTDQIEAVRDEVDELTSYYDGLIDRLGLTTGATEESTAATKESTEATERNNQIVTAAEDAERRRTEGLLAWNEAAKEQFALEEQKTEAIRRAADATYAVRDAQVEYLTSVAAANEAIADQGAESWEQAEAIDGVRESAISLADEQVRLAAETAEASGKQLTAQERANLFRQSLIDLASQLSGPQRDALLEYIALLEAIPTNKTTTITAVGGSVRYRASGGVVGANEPFTVVGEQGPEIVSLPAGSRVHTAGESRRMMGATGGAGLVANITVNAPTGWTGAAQQMLIQELERWWRERGYRA